MMDTLTMTHADSPLLSHRTEPARTGGRAIQVPLNNYITTLTPPVLSGDVEWSGPGTIPMESLAISATDSDQPASESQDATPHAEPAGTTEAPAIVLGGGPMDEGHAWIEGAIQALRKSALPSMYWAVR